MRCDVVGEGSVSFYRKDESAILRLRKQTQLDLLDTDRDAGYPSRGTRTWRCIETSVVKYCIETSVVCHCLRHLSASTRGRVGYISTLSR